MSVLKVSQLSMCVAVSLMISSTIVFAKSMPPANRVSIEAARAEAIKAYSGKIAGEELEFEGGKWIYSFDLKGRSDKRVHEVHVDAISGKLLDSHTETAADERKEQKEDAAKASSSQ